MMPDRTYDISPLALVSTVLTATPETGGSYTYTFDVSNDAVPDRITITEDVAVEMLRQRVLDRLKAAGFREAE